MNNLEYFIDTDQLKDYLPSLASNVDYWLFRANGGQYYDDFNAGNYIGIGWELEPLATIQQFKNRKDQLRAKIAKDYPKEKQPGSTASQLLKFIDDLKINDIVLVPSENSERYLIGKIIGDAYEEKEDELLDERRHCPYKKRRKTEWIGIVDRNKADSALYKLVYAGHTLSNANDYKPYINRALFDSYIENGTMHSTFMVNEPSDIDMYEFSKFQYAFSELHHQLFPTEKLVSKTNVQSLGPLEVIGLYAGIATISGLLFFFLKSYVKSITLKVGPDGGKIKIVKDDPKVNNWHIEKENRELRLKEIAAADQHDKELLKNVKTYQELSEKAGSAMENIDISFSDEFTTAIKKMNQSTTDPSEKSKN